MILQLYVHKSLFNLIKEKSYFIKIEINDGQLDIVSQYYCDFTAIFNSKLMVFNQYLIYVHTSFNSPFYLIKYNNKSKFYSYYITMSEVNMDVNDNLIEENNNNEFVSRNNDDKTYMINNENTIEYKM